MKQKHKQHNWRLYAIGLIETLSVFVCLLTVVGFAGRWWWAFELASHFRFQYVWFLAIAALVLFVAGRFKAGFAVAGCSLINACLVVPLYLGQPADVPGRVQLLVVNVDKANRQFDRGLQLVQQYDPDIIVLVEATPGWVDAMDEMRVRYETAYTLPRMDSKGLAVYSRFPLIDVRVESLLGNVPVIVARLDVDGQALTVIAAHTKPPISPDYAKSRNRQLAQIGEIARGCEGAVAIAGDLNTTSWSPCFQDLMKRSDLRDSRDGFGVQGSWPAGPPSAFHIPIDHCLVSRQIEVVDRRVAHDIGSDHYPVVVEFAIQSDALAEGRQQTEKRQQRTTAGGTGSDAG